MSIHLGEQGHVAEEGQYSVASSDEPVLHYFPVRGRAEPIRLLMALREIRWYEPPIEPIYSILHQELDGYPFRQLPRFTHEVNGTVDISQSMAIIRHLARKLEAYGSTTEQAANIDMIIEAVKDLRELLKEVWVVKGLSPEACQQYINSAMAPEEELTASSAQGPGLACLERILARADAARARQTDSEGSPWLVGQAISAADIVAFDLVDLHHQVPQLAEALTRFPLLLRHHGQVAAQPGIAAYLKSDNRHSLVWLVEWLKQRG